MQQYHCPASARSAGSAVADGDSKIITDLERVGDEAEKIAVCTQRLTQAGAQPHLMDGSALKQAGAMAISMLHRALESFMHLDTAATAQIVRDDCVINEAF